MDIKRAQIPTNEERIILRKLALAAARDGCKILEIGSWCGDSSVVLGKVAQDGVRSAIERMWKDS